MGAVTDRRNVRVMIPRVRRAIDGPAADSPAAPSTTLTDDQYMQTIADAIADVILYTNGVFGKSLEVLERDDYYLAPTEYQTSGELSLDEQTVIITQAALSYHFNYLRDLKVSERITNDAVEWEYALSANILRDHLKALQDARDKALEAITATQNINLDGYASFIQVRDIATSVAIEPWVDGNSLGGAVISDTRPGFWGP